MEDFLLESLAACGPAFHNLILTVNRQGTFKSGPNIGTLSTT